MTKTLRNLLIMVITAAIIGVIAIVIITYYAHNPGVTEKPSEKAKDLVTFSSCEELREALIKQPRYGSSPVPMMIKEEALTDSEAFGLGSGDGLELGGLAKNLAGETAFGDFSTTNVQVQGIDEADIVKTDGKYIYTLSLSGKKLSIVDAYPAAGAEIISQSVLEIDPNEMFINGDYLMIFGTINEQVVMEDEYDFFKKSYYPRSRTFTAVEIWNISNRNNPQKERSIELEGSYRTARKIDDQVYFVINTYPNYTLLEREHPSSVLPLFRDRDLTKDYDETFYPSVLCTDIAYFNNVQPSQFVTVASISLKNSEQPVAQEVILGSANNVYASFNNLYLSEQKYDWNLGWFYEDSEQYSVIHAFALDQGKSYYQGYMEAPGTILNQFSMDENNGYFRIATTRSNVSTSDRGQTTTNNIYIFDSDLMPVGSLEDLAPGEKIYSARFIDDRAYLVTFKQVDPFYVLDLSDPKNPVALGELKIPGYSDYLHPYDKNHIIGIGKDTNESAQIQGLKMALFDVNDVADPKEVHKLVLGERGTDSPALSDHKAFLFDLEKNLLVLPINLFEKTALSSADPGFENAMARYPQNTFRGAYVYNLSIADGFNLIGRITHYPDAQPVSYFSTRNFDILRNLYIDDNLYSVSEGKIKINSLKNLAEIKDVSLVMPENDPLARSRDIRRISDIKQIQTALEIYYAEQNGYPVLENSITLGPSNYKCLDKNGFQEEACLGQSVYMIRVPGDPGEGKYIYTSSEKETYSLVFTLETDYKPYNGKNCVAGPSGISCN